MTYDRMLLPFAGSHDDQIPSGRRFFTAAVAQISCHIERLCIVSDAPPGTIMVCSLTVGPYYKILGAEEIPIEAFPAAPCPTCMKPHPASVNLGRVNVGTTISVELLNYGAPKCSFCGRRRVSRSDDWQLDTCPSRKPIQHWRARVYCEVIRADCSYGCQGDYV